MKINKKFALQLPKHDFYSFKLCTVGLDKVHAVRPVDNNNDMLFPSEKFNSLNVWVAAKKRKTHPLSNADKNAFTCDSSKLTSFDFFSKQIR